MKVKDVWLVERAKTVSDLNRIKGKSKETFMVRGGRHLVDSITSEAVHNGMVYRVWKLDDTNYDRLIEQAKE